MIEITHQNAQRLLRAAVDNPLPNEQWTMLQAHLETCEACRSYGERLGGLEKSLKRALRAGWESAPGPGEDTAGLVLQSIQVRSSTRKKMLHAGLAVVLLVGLVLLVTTLTHRARLASGPITVTGDTHNSAAMAPTTEATGAQTPVATAEAGDFPDVVAYEGRHDGKPNGDGEIYLLNPGSPPANLTNNPAQDSDPAWSPDGEWLAFLSDRSRKTELYVINITGSRLVQLSDEPGVTWEGPLSWSPDGKLIALSGVREEQGGQRWVYLVGLDGSGARALSGSRGGAAPRFSPSGDRLAYIFSDGTVQGITVDRVKTGEKVSASWFENPLVPPSATGSAFDWSVDGAGLAYVAADLNPSGSTVNTPGQASLPPGQPGSQVVVVRDLNDTLSAFDDANRNFQIDRSRWPGAYRGASWTPDGAVVYLEDLGDARANDKPSIKPGGCWTVQMSFAVYHGQFDRDNQDWQNTAHLASYGGLCVEGGLNSTSWTPDGHWIVVQGRLPSETRPSIFALSIASRTAQSFVRRDHSTPTPTANEAPGTILRLTNDPWSGPLPSPRPRLSRSTRPLRIDPQPVN